MLQYQSWSDKYILMMSSILRKGHPQVTVQTTSFCIEKWKSIHCSYIALYYEVTQWLNGKEIFPKFPKSIFEYSVLLIELVPLKPKVMITRQYVGMNAPWLQLFLLIWKRKKDLLYFLQTLDERWHDHMELILRRVRDYFCYIFWFKLL